VDKKKDKVQKQVRRIEKNTKEIFIMYFKKLTMLLELSQLISFTAEICHAKEFDKFTNTSLKQETRNTVKNASETERNNNAIERDSDNYDK
jgi:hypothetical protein